MDARLGQIPIEDPDVSTPRGRGAQPLELIDLVIAVDRLDDEHRPLVRREGPGERLDEATRVLPLHDTEEVEAEEEEERVRYAEVRSCQRRRRRRDHGMREDEYRLGDALRDHRRREFA